MSEAPNLIYLVLLLVLVGSALVGRQIPMGQAARMFLGWVAIFGIAFILFTFRDEFSAFGQKIKNEISGEPVVAGETVRVPMSDDGHFWVAGRINGHPTRFLVDSGASVTTVSRSTAQAAGLETGVRVQPVETANGTVMMRRSNAESLSIATISREGMGINVNPIDGVNVLGMNFLSSLAGWRVEGRYLVLQP
jgi:aspartyl protease family protein